MTENTLENNGFTEPSGKRVAETVQDFTLEHETLPGLYQSADTASVKAQALYFWGLRLYLVLLVVAALVSFLWGSNSYGSIASAALFLFTLGLLVFLRVSRPDDIWYNGRAVAESVKTRSWRWVMRAEPYDEKDSIDQASGQFLDDLKAILSQNESLSKALDPSAGFVAPISKNMRQIRELPVKKRLEIYEEQRIEDQANWYSKKAQINKRKSRACFAASVVLHASAILMLLYKIKAPMMAIPVESVAVAAGAVLTWMQAKKHNELSSSYALATHEIALIQGEASSVKTEKELSGFVVNSENAFSREHTQWIAKKAG